MVKGNERFCMISQPMTGLSDKEISKTKQRLELLAESHGYIVINTWFNENEVFENIDQRVNKPLYMLANSLECMSFCDCVIFANGWQNTRGCILEHQVSVNYGLDIIYETPNSIIHENVNKTTYKGVGTDGLQSTT